MQLLQFHWFMNSIKHIKILHFKVKTYSHLLTNKGYSGRIKG